MWNGANLQDAIKSFIQNGDLQSSVCMESFVRDGVCVHPIEPCLCGLQGSATVLDKPLPRRVENVEQACDRYVQEMEVREPTVAALTY